MNHFPLQDMIPASEDGRRAHVPQGTDIANRGGVEALIHIGGRTYELIRDHKDGWNPDAFRERYSEVLERYDYVVGDWGYNQLRLKGFFRDNHPKVTRDTAFSGMLDYINEYCNFGCAYFVLQRHAGLKRHDEDADDSDYDEADGAEAESYEAGGELPVRTALAGETEVYGAGAEPQRTTPRIVREHQKKEYHPRHMRKDAPDKDKEARDGRDGRKPNGHKDRDRETTRPQSADSRQQDRNHGGSADRERGGRHRKPHFTAPKAPVAAALETNGQPNPSRQQNAKPKDQGGKQ